jgi:hypothetical protein
MPTFLASLAAPFADPRRGSHERARNGPGFRRDNVGEQTGSLRDAARRPLGSTFARFSDVESVTDRRLRTSLRLVCSALRWSSTLGWYGFARDLRSCNSRAEWLLSGVCNMAALSANSHWQVVPARLLSTRTGGSRAWWLHVAFHRRQRSLMTIRRWGRPDVPGFSAARR